MRDKYLKYFLDKLHSGELVYREGTLKKWVESKQVYKEVGRTTSKGYRQITAVEDGKEISCVAHRIIFAYCKCLNELPKDKEINHINGNKTDNRIENLELVTASRNCKHAYEIGLKKKQYGETNPCAKLKNKEVFAIKILIDKGLTSKTIADIFGCTPQNINLIRKGKKWKELRVDIYD